jgi:tetratricopeptide (TPR) repeat protein
MLNNLGEAVGRSTHYQEAVEYFKAALAIDNDLGDRFATGKKLANLGLAYTAIGLYRRAERYLRKALELHETIGHPGLLNDVMVSLGVAVANQGDHDAAVALLTDAARVARRRGDTRTELRAEVHLCSSESTTDPVAARIRASEVLERSRAEGLRSTQVRALHILAVLAAERGGHGDAVAFEREAVKLFRAGAAPLDGVRSLHNLGILLRDHPALAESEDEHRSLLREAATRIGRRLEELRDPELRAGYVAQPAVARILEDGGE